MIMESSIRLKFSLNHVDNNIFLLVHKRESVGVGKKSMWLIGKLSNKSMVLFHVLLVINKMFFVHI